MNDENQIIEKIELISQKILNLDPLKNGYSTKYNRLFKKKK
jgi:hypothetical protein